MDIPRDYFCQIKQHRAGFTLTELIIVIAIVAILVTVAAPSFTGIIANQRAKAVASDLYATLSFARSAAITRNTNVTVSPKSANWQNGWQVLDATSAVLDDRGAAVGITVSGAPTNVVYTPSGRMAAGVAPSFIFTPTSGTTTQCVSISLSGRPYMKPATSC